MKTSHLQTSWSLNKLNLTQLNPSNFKLGNDWIFV